MCHYSSVGRPEYPRDIRAFRQKFATQEACAEYLIRCRWPEGFVCPQCSGTSGTRLRTRPLFLCRACRHQTSPTSGTIMHRSPIPICEVAPVGWTVCGYSYSAGSNRGHTGMSAERADECGAARHLGELRGDAIGQTLALLQRPACMRNVSMRLGDVPLAFSVQPRLSTS